MSGIVEKTKRRLGITLMMILCAVVMVAAAAFCLLPVATVKCIYDFFAGQSEATEAFKWPFFIYMLRVGAVMHVWLAATFILILTNPVKYQTLYWVNMLAVLAAAIMCVGAGIRVSVPVGLWLVDGLLALVGAVLLFLVRPRPSL